MNEIIFPLKVTVTQADIDLAIKEYPNSGNRVSISCPVYQALTRVGLKNLQVGINMILMGMHSFKLKDAYYYTGIGSHKWSTLKPGGEFTVTPK